MLSILDNAPDVQTRKLRQQYLRPSEVEHAIRRVIDARLDNAPLRVLDTNTGLLCDRETQIGTFKMSTQYMELVSSTITHVDLHIEHIEEVVKRYLQYAMLSHRWEGKEPLLQDIQGKTAWNTHGWTFQEFIVPKVILFYQNNWTLYRFHRNHAGDEDTTGIDQSAVAAFHPNYGEKQDKALGRLLQEIRGSVGGHHWPQW
ncbi:uncharacterized protein F5147DRAFT_661617, partial [Suillus discolor]